MKSGRTEKDKSSTIIIMKFLILVVIRALSLSVFVTSAFFVVLIWIVPTNSEVVGSFTTFIFGSIALVTGVVFGLTFSRWTKNW